MYIKVLDLNSGFVKHLARFLIIRLVWNYGGCVTQIDSKCTFMRER